MIADFKDLSKYCLAKRLPEKIIALLSVFNFDTNELDSLNIKYEYQNSCNYCVINDIKYLILDEIDSKIIINKTLEQYINTEYRPELPEWAEAYIDWDKFKNDIGFTIEFLIPEIEKIIINNSIFYYVQLNDFSIDCC